MRVTCRAVTIAVDNRSRAIVYCVMLRVLTGSMSLHAFSCTCVVVALFLVNESLPAQPTIGATIGGASSAWSGPYQRGGYPGMSLGAWGEFKTGQRTSARVDLGYGSASADFGTLGLFSEGTTLYWEAVHVAGTGRIYSPTSKTGWRAFFELGGGIWRQSSCDVDMETNLGFFGGSTESCRAWSVATLRPRTAGALVLAGAGFRVRRLAGAVRYWQPLSAVIESDAGSLRMRALRLDVDWTILR